MSLSGAYILILKPQYIKNLQCRERGPVAQASLLHSFPFLWWFLCDWIKRRQCLLIL